MTQNARATLAKDPLCRQATAYEELGLSACADHRAVMEAFRQGVRSVGPLRAAAARGALCVAERRLVEDTLFYFEQEPERKMDLSAEARPDLLEHLYMALHGRHDTCAELQRAAVLTLWWALHLAQTNRSEDALDGPWPASAGLWAVVLHDDGFWRSWLLRRCPTYGKDAGEVNLAEVRADLSRRLGSITAQFADAELADRAAAVLDFQTSALQGARDVIMPFLRASARTVVPPLIEMCPALASACGDPAVLADITGALLAARPAKGGVTRARWLAASRLLAKLLAARHPPAAEMLATTEKRRPQEALRSGEQALPGVPRGEDAGVAIRWAAVVAYVESASMSASAGPDRVNEVIGAIGHVVAILDRLAPLVGSGDSMLCRVLAQLAPYERDSALDLMERAAGVSVVAFRQRHGDDDPAGVSRAIAVLELTHSVLASARSEERAKHQCKAIGHLYIERCHMNAVAGRRIEAARDFQLARQWDPENPVVKAMEGGTAP